MILYFHLVMQLKIPEQLKINITKPNQYKLN